RMSEVARIEARVYELRRGYAQLQRSIAASFLGQEEVTELRRLALFADGHAPPRDGGRRSTALPFRGGPDLHAGPARRRDQPRHAAHAVGAPRGDAGA